MRPALFLRKIHTPPYVAIGGYSVGDRVCPLFLTFQIDSQTIPHRYVAMARYAIRDKVFGSGWRGAWPNGLKSQSESQTELRSGDVWACALIFRRYHHFEARTVKLNRLSYLIRKSCKCLTSQRVKQPRSTLHTALTPLCFQSARGVSEQLCGRGLTFRSPFAKRLQLHDLEQIRGFSAR